jgi:hypothetical protein
LACIASRAEELEEELAEAEEDPEPEPVRQLHQATALVQFQIYKPYREDVSEVILIKLQLSAMQKAEE